MAPHLAMKLVEKKKKKNPATSGHEKALSKWLSMLGGHNSGNLLWSWTSFKNWSGKTSNIAGLPDGFNAASPAPSNKTYGTLATLTNAR